MRNKIIINLSLIAFVFVFFICMLNIEIFASPTSDLFEGTSMSGANELINDTTGIFGGINTVIGLLQMAGTGVSLIVITFLGIKYMVASVEDKAEIKKSALPIVIGCVLLFGAVNIIALIESFANAELNL